MSVFNKMTYDIMDYISRFARDPPQYGKEFQLTELDLANLARVNRSFNQAVIPVLYKRNKAYGQSSAAVWGARNGQLGTVEKAVEYGLVLEVKAGPGYLFRYGMFPEGEYREKPKPTSYYRNLEMIKAEGDNSDCVVEPEKSALYHAIRSRSRAVVAYLLNKGVSVHFAPDERLLARRNGTKGNVYSKLDKIHTLHYAAEAGMISVVEYFYIGHALDENLTDSTHHTALHHAAHGPQNSEMIQYLLSGSPDINGLDINRLHPDSHVSTPLCTAFASDNLENAETLLVAGADINLQKKGGRALVYCAASRRQRKRYVYEPDEWERKHKSGYAYDAEANWELKLQEDALDGVWDAQKDAVMRSIIQQEIVRGTLHQKIAGELSPLTMALMKGSANSVNMLIHVGFDVNELDPVVNMKPIAIAWGRYTGENKFPRSGRIIRENLVVLKLLLWTGKVRLDEPFFTAYDKKEKTVLERAAELERPLNRDIMIELLKLPLVKHIVSDEHLSQVLKWAFLDARVSICSTMIELAGAKLPVMDTDEFHELLKSRNDLWRWFTKKPLFAHLLDSVLSRSKVDLEKLAELSKERDDKDVASHFQKRLDGLLPNMRRADCRLWIN
ncbi:ankyrin repeat-containing domain protein [Xylariaceae sp. FL0255]|nr:ankyrin repeat-containing domain protein [Xylariaceae sp. FL0255]